MNEVLRSTPQEVSSAYTQFEQYQRAGVINADQLINLAGILHEGRDYLEKPQKEVFEAVREAGRNEKVWDAMWDKLFELDDREDPSFSAKAAQMQRYLGAADIFGMAELGEEAKQLLADLAVRYDFKTGLVPSHPITPPSVVTESVAEAVVGQDQQEASILQPGLSGKEGTGQFLAANGEQPAEKLIPEGKEKEVMEAIEQLRSLAKRTGDFFPAILMSYDYGEASDEDGSNALLSEGIDLQIQLSDLLGLEGDASYVALRELERSRQPLDIDRLLKTVQKGDLVKQVDLLRKMYSKAPKDLQAALKEKINLYSRGLGEESDSSFWELQNAAAGIDRERGWDAMNKSMTALNKFISLLESPNAETAESIIKAFIERNQTATDDFRVVMEQVTDYQKKLAEEAGIELVPDEFAGVILEEIVPATPVDTAGEEPQNTAREITKWELLAQEIDKIRLAKDLGDGEPIKEAAQRIVDILIEDDNPMGTVSDFQYWYPNVVDLICNELQSRQSEAAKKVLAVFEVAEQAEELKQIWARRKEKYRDRLDDRDFVDQVVRETEAELSPCANKIADILIGLDPVEAANVFAYQHKDVKVFVEDVFRERNLKETRLIEDIRQAKYRAWQASYDKIRNHSSEIVTPEELDTLFNKALEAIRNAREERS